MLLFFFSLSLYALSSVFEIKQLFLSQHNLLGNNKKTKKEKRKENGKISKENERGRKTKRKGNKQNNEERNEEIRRNKNKAGIS